MKVLIATDKPFSSKAVEGIKSIVEGAGHTLAILEKYGTEDKLIEQVADADALIVRSDKVTPNVVAAAKNLKIVVRAGAGFDNLDLASLSERKIVAMNTPGQNSNAVAELAIGMMIYISRNLFTPGTGSELKGKTLGIQAYGNVGRLVAEHAKSFGMTIMAFDPFISAQAMEKEGVIVAKDLEELYSKSDFISLHIPANEHTKGSIGYALLSKMPNGGCLVTTARKEVINEPELEKVMEERDDLKYITDIAPSNLDTLKEKFGKRIFATPKKQGAETAEANLNAGLAAANQIVDFFATGNTKFQVNKF